MSPRLRWCLFLGLLTASLAAFGLAVYVELTVRDEMGRGLTRNLGYLFYKSDIREYRRMVLHYALAGTGLLVLSYVLRPFGRRSAD